MDAAGVIGSFGAAVVAGGALFDLVRRAMNRRVDDRKADAEAEGLELSNAKTLQELIREPLAAMHSDNAELRGELGELRERVHELQEERDAEKDRVADLENVVEALRNQIRAFGQAPAA